MFLNKKFIGFCAIGIINTFNTAFFSWLAHFKIQENISAHIGFFISLTINYILTLVSFITINLWQLDQFWATVLATAAGGPITFVIIKIYAFGNRIKEKDDI